MSECFDVESMIRFIADSKIWRYTVHVYTMMVYTVLSSSSVLCTILSMSAGCAGQASHSQC